MNCPRCGVSAHADRSTCPACSWTLWQPFASDSGDPNGRKGITGVEGTEGLQTAADAFALTPPGRFDRTPRPLVRRLGRRPWPRRREPRVGGDGVAVLPEEARWEAPPRLEVIEMPLVQTSFDFSVSSEVESLPARGRVAPLEARLEAGLVDAALILAAGLGFFALFAGLGGELGLGRRDLLVYLLVAYSLACLYFGLFTLSGGRTPGMRRCGLSLLTFEGQPLTRQHTLWRAFGYVASTGALLIGFFWAAVDERTLTWHDLISRTFLAPDSTR